MKRVIEDSILNDIAKAIQEKNGTDTKYEDVEMAQAVRDISTSKEEQEKTINVTENGVTEILPDDNKVLSKVTVDVNVADNYYDIFLDTIQGNGNRTDYRCAFYVAQSSVIPFNDCTFKPKYNMIPKTAHGMFKSAHISNLIDILKNCNVILDTRYSIAVGDMFSYSRVTHLPCISFESVTSTIGSFVLECSYLIYIEKMIVLKENTWSTNNFKGCTKLATIGEIEGEIGTSFNISSCESLDAPTAKLILTHLFNYAGTEDEFVNSITFHPDVWNRLDAEGETSPDGTTWKVYTDSKGWNY